MSVLSEPRFHDPIAALAHVESVLWPNGPVCPHCGATDRLYTLTGKSTKPGVRKCGHCKKLFTVTVGTVFESSHIPLNKWLQALHLLCSSKKGISSHQLHRTLEITYKSAWFMSHRLREAMKAGALGPLGGEGKIVEADETYFGDKEVVTHRTFRGKAGLGSKRAVVSLVERGGSVRSFYVGTATKAQVGKIVADNVARTSVLMTDESKLYTDVGPEFVTHETVKHTANEYVRGRTHTNTVEGVYSIFKRGMKGVYQHCAEKHLHRYLAEFDFRYSNRVAAGVDDAARAAKALAGIRGKRLTYRRADNSNSA